MEKTTLTEEQIKQVIDWINKNDFRNCNVCMYKDTSKCNKDFCQADNAALAIVTALATKHIKKDYLYKDGQYVCPLCGYPLSSGEAVVKCYCDNCGQAIRFDNKLLS